MKWLGVVGLLVLAPNAQAGLIYNQGFENGAAKDLEKATCSSVDFKFETNIVRNGKYAGKMSKRANQGVRCEIIPRRDKNIGQGGDFLWGNEYWAGFSFYIPSNAPLTGWGSIHQHHSANPEGRTPYCGFMGGNGFSLSAAGGEFRILLTPSGNLNQRGGLGAGAAQAVAYTWPLQKNKWVDVVMNFKYSDKSDGFWKIWVNGKQVINRTGSNVNLWSGSDPKNVFNGACSSKNLKARKYYQAYGIYVGTKGSGTIIYDEIKNGDANSSYKEVAPGGRGTISGTIPVTNTAPRSQKQPQPNIKTPPETPPNPSVGISNF